MNRIHIYEKNIGCCSFHRFRSIRVSILEYFSLEMIMITMCQHIVHSILRIDYKFWTTFMTGVAHLFYSNARLSPLYCCCSSCLILIQRENNCRRNLRNRVDFSPLWDIFPNKRREGEKRCCCSRFEYNSGSCSPLFLFVTVERSAI